ncbi:MAG: MerR family transcriptional regulator, partial [Actinomycetes bacterium]
VFGIAVGRVWREVEGELASLPAERPEDEHDHAESDPAADHPGDELSARRRARKTG